MNKAIKSIASAVTLFACTTVPAVSGPIVQTEMGAVRGSAVKGMGIPFAEPPGESLRRHPPAAWVEGIESFKGIPFAAPPVGPLRWHAPVAPAAWNSVRDATEFGHDCMQKPFPSDAAPLGTEPSEDCLYLNVWRPAGADAGDKLPVLVWIYGGGLVNGGSSASVYDGSAFAKQGIVFVSFNYRVGRFGFFAHPALSAAGEGPEGNWGLMDQHAALEWVQRNISAFGGDPSEVTIMGESAGGISVLDLIGAPAAHGTFQRAIVMSGVGRDSGALRMRPLSEDQPDFPSAETIGMRFAESKGIDGVGPEALERLRALPAEDVVDGLNLSNLSTELFSGRARDGITLVDSNENTFARGAQAKVPVMIGATSADLGFYPAETKEQIFAIFGDDADAARQDYDPSGDLPLAIVAQKVGGDQVMVEPARFIAREVFQGGEPAYYYRFSYVADAADGPNSFGAAHASDIPFFFDTVAARYGDELTPMDEAAADAANSYVVSFVKTGVPSASGLPEWPVIGENDIMMDVTASGEIVVGPDPWRARLDRIEQLASDSTQ